MPGRLAVDFGTSNTVVAQWNEAEQTSVPLHVPDLGQYYEHGTERVCVVPSLIHYSEDQRRWLGAQVLERNLYESPHTFRWMKRYISDRNPSKVRLNGREISHFDAGRDFLSSVLLFASAELGISDEEIALTLPVEGFEHYEDWLSGVAEAAGMPRFRLIDEPSAAALGYGAHIQPGDVYLIFDFGGGTLDVAVVLVEEDPADSGRRCRVLGKAGADVGGALIDQWLFQEVLKRNRKSDSDADIRKLSRAILVECERAKEKLSSYERTDVSVMDPDSGSIISTDFTQKQFEDLLDEHEAFTVIDQTIRRAMNGAIGRGYSEDNIKSVLMVGGSSLIPSVQRTLQRIFGRDRVMLNRPLDAVARGAAAFVAGVDFYDHIQHDYAIRYLNPQKGGYDYKVVVRRGTPYPSKEPVARMRIKGAYDGQTRLGIAIFEMGDIRRSSSQRMELVFDPSGAARLAPVTPNEEDRRRYFWMNEHNQTFLFADPPAVQGEPRFEVEFNIDGNKRLLFTARDIKTGETTHRDYPVVKLT